MSNIYILVACAALAAVWVSAYHGSDLPPGPYCGLGGRRGGCCKNRRDNCSHPILDTLCYCDEFCKQVGSGQQDDCCPDYELVCLHETPPDQILDPVCILGRTKRDKCSSCECTMVNGQPDWKCDNPTCLMSEAVVKNVNFRPQGWRAATYPEFMDRSLKEGLTYKLGTLDLSPATLRMGSISYMKDIAYPTNFDARKKWPNYISEIEDQRWCGSDWALTIASITSDRFAISSEGAESVSMSPQTLLSCGVYKNTPYKLRNTCDGGHVDVAWNYVGKYGLVDESCLPYVAKVTNCPYNPDRANLITAGCRPKVASRTERYSVSVPYRLNSEKDIMYELMNSGPVHAIMNVHQDFFHYRDGVYHHTVFGDQKKSGLHSVKIIGWGEDKGQKYWIVANTWGKQWGENGYFRIRRGENESGIESFIVAAISYVSNHK